VWSEAAEVLTKTVKSSGERNFAKSTMRSQTKLAEHEDVYSII